MRLVIVRSDPNFRKWDVVAPQARGLVIGHVHAVIGGGYEAYDRHRNALGNFRLRSEALAAVEAARLGRST